MSIKKLSILIFLIPLSSMAIAPAFVKLDEKAANGDCLPQLDGAKAEEILTKYSIKFSRENASDRLAVARVIAAIDTLSGGKSELPKGASFVFRTGQGASRFNGKDIEINDGEQNRSALRKKSDGCKNTGLIAHELCHRMGAQALSSRPGVRAYDYYMAQVSSKCTITNYATNNGNDNPRNEEFAEVCASFITNPEILEKNSSDSCKAAAKVFEEIIGNQRNQSQVSACDPKSDLPPSSSPAFYQYRQQ